MIEISKEVKDAGLRKWLMPQIIGPNIIALEKWWVSYGIGACSFCRLLDAASLECEDNCPLYDGTGACAEPWNVLYEGGHTAEEFLALAQEMFDLIEAVEVE